MTTTTSGAALGGLPYGAFSVDGGLARLGVRIGAEVLDLAAFAELIRAPYASLCRGPVLNPLMAAGPQVWAQLRADLASWLASPAGAEPGEHRLPLGRVRLHLPFEVADYVDFYSSEAHATNVGRIFRPDGDALTPNWKHLPIGYHGRAGTVVVSGTPVVRPHGQRRPAGDPLPTFGPSRRLDIEAEVGFVVGVPADGPVAAAALAEYVFGVVLVNDWSARDLQAWEYVPLGPFLGKSFATSISAWVMPLAALDHARVDPPERDTPVLPYLADPPGRPWGLDLRLTVTLNGQPLSRPPFAAMYWTPAQQLAHLTVNGATLRTGDLFASGTVSGPNADGYGSLLELSWGGRDAITLPDGTSRTFLEDGDDVAITATAPGPDGSTVELGEVRGTIEPALS